MRHYVTQGLSGDRVSCPERQAPLERACPLRPARPNSRDRGSILARGCRGPGVAPDPGRSTTDALRSWTVSLIIAFAVSLATSAEAQQGGYDGTFVSEFTRHLTQFTEVDTSYAFTAGVPYPTGAGGQTGVIEVPPASGEPTVPFEAFEGAAYNLVEARAMPTVAPLDGETGAFAHTNLNTLLGADRFYSAGIFGENAVTANIEGGRAWSGHESLLHANAIPQNLLPSRLDRHATWTGMLIAGRPGGAEPGPHQIGIAPLSEFHSGGFASGWGGAKYSFAFTYFSNVLFDQYNQAMITGLSGPEGTRTADVVNSSYALLGLPLTTQVELMLDAMAATNPGSVMTVAVGNNGFGINTVTPPATGYNNIAVAGLSALTDYETASLTSSGGNIDYRDPVNGTATGGRRGVDIAAPGEDIGSAYYGGETGGNAETLPGPAHGSPGGPNYYTRSLDGTSYASPLVAGGVALIQDAAKTLLPDTTTARDARVIKGVLMNSAHKTTGWNNGQAPHPNLGGGVITVESLDSRVGAGRMDLDRAFDQFLSGTTDVPGTTFGDQGTVEATGWDFGAVAEGITTDYVIEPLLKAGSTFTATLTWFRDRRMFDTGNGFEFIDDNYSDLNLEVWSVTGGTPDMLISESIAPFTSTEHLSFALPETGNYMLRVRWFREWFDIGEQDPNEVLFGLAWSGVAIPEPTTFVLLSICLIGGGLFARRRAL